MKKKLLSLLLSLLIAVPAFASVGVSPTRIEVNANKIKGNYYTTAIEIKGDTAQPVRFKVYPGYFKINEKGEAVMLEKSTDEFDLSKKIRFVPSEFTVARGKVQKVRINIPNINNLPNGENRAMLFIEDINPREMNIPTGQAGIGAQLIIKTRVGVPIYVDKGRVIKSADVEYMNIVKQNDGLYTEMKILSKGNSKVRYTANGQICQGKKLVKEYPMSGKTVALNSYYVDKQLIDTKDLKPGEYTLRVIISYFDENGKKKIISKETTLNIQGSV